MFTIYGGCNCTCSILSYRHTSVISCILHYHISNNDYIKACKHSVGKVALKRGCFESSPFLLGGRQCNIEMVFEWCDVSLPCKMGQK